MQTDNGIHIATTIQVQVHPNGVVRVGAASRSLALPMRAPAHTPMNAERFRVPRLTQK